MNNLSENATIIYIPVNEITAHPNNPRKDLGDLTELSESIRKNGVLQNLTVVPNADENSGYTAVIGHRRLEASKMAGLEAVPCVISHLTEQEQVRTMLMENMQRSDLTVYEQAQGFQMMMDLGDTAEAIADKTGFSASTVRRRLKLLELDKEKFAAASERGATLMDFAAFFGAKSSMQMTSFSRINCVDSLCAASCRWLAICSCSIATLIRAFSPRLLPFDFRESCRWRRASFFSDFARYLWFGYETPSEVTAKALTPTSIPTAAPVGGIGLISTSVQQIDTKYLPLGFWLMVAERIRPLTALLTRHFTRPSLGSCTALSSTLIFVPTHLLL